MVKREVSMDLMGGMGCLVSLMGLCRNRSRWNCLCNFVLFYIYRVMVPFPHLSSPYPYCYHPFEKVKILIIVGKIQLDKAELIIIFFR